MVYPLQWVEPFERAHDPPKARKLPLRRAGVAEARLADSPTASQCGGQAFARLIAQSALGGLA